MSAGFKGGTLSQYIRLGVIKEDIHYQLHVCSSPKRFMYLLPPINLIIRDSQGHTRTHKDTHTHTHGAHKLMQAHTHKKTDNLSQGASYLGQEWRLFGCYNCERFYGQWWTKTRVLLQGAPTVIKKTPKTRISWSLQTYTIHSAWVVT